MKFQIGKIQIGLVLAGVLSLAQLAYSAEPRGKPYIGSEWQIQGLLPYSQCEIVSHYQEGIPINGTVGFGFGVTTFFENGGYLSCSSGKNKDYPFLVPVYFDHLFHIGAIVELTRGSEVKFEVKKLRGKKLEEFFRTYRGASIGLNPFLVGGKAGIMASWKGVQIQFKNSTVGPFPSAAFAYTSFTLKPGSKDTLVAYDNESGNRQVLGDVAQYHFVKIPKDVEIVGDYFAQGN